MLNGVLFKPIYTRYTKTFTSPLNCKYLRVYSLLTNFSTSAYLNILIDVKTLFLILFVD